MTAPRDPATLDVAILMPAYNHAPFAAEAARSALAQEWPAHWRPLTILFSDDASADSTFDVLREVVAAYDGPHRVTLRRNARTEGLEHTNTVIDAVRADFYVFCCSDDVQLPARARRSVEIHAATGAGVVTSNAFYADAAARGDTVLFRPERLADQSLDRFLSEGWVESCFGAGMAFSRALRDTFGRLPIHLRNQDIVLPFRGLLSGGNAVIPEPLLRWRIHGDNTTLEVLKRRARDDAERLAYDERDKHNRTANWLAMLADFDAWTGDAAAFGGRARVRERLLQRVADSAREWAAMRDAMVAAGAGIR